MSEKNIDLIINLVYEGRKTKFRLSDATRCKNYVQLGLTGIIYDSYPRQFEVKCSCGCGYSGIACMVEEEEQLMK